MTTPVIIDAFIVVVLVGFCLWGAHRGLFRSLAGLVIIVAALVGAGMLASTFSASITAFVTPLIRSEIIDYVEETADIQLDLPDTQLPTEVNELLMKMGLDEESREKLQQQAEEKVVKTGVDAVTALVESIVQRFVYAILFILFFLALMVLLNVLLAAMDLVLKLPGLHLLNSLGGGLVGLIEGALLLFLAVWVLRCLGVSFETAALAEAHILRIFTANTPLSVLSFLL